MGYVEIMTMIVANKVNTRSIQGRLCLSTFPLLQCKRVNPRRLSFRHRSRWLSTASGCPVGPRAGGELWIWRPMYSSQLSRSGLGSFGSFSSSASSLDGVFCLTVGSDDGLGGFCFSGCVARCFIDGRRGSFIDIAGDVKMSSFLLFLCERVGIWGIPCGFWVCLDWVKIL